jgi:hypothetical protein
VPRERIRRRRVRQVRPRVRRVQREHTLVWQEQRVLPHVLRVPLERTLV